MNKLPYNFLIISFKKNFSSRINRARSIKVLTQIQERFYYPFLALVHILVQLQAYPTYASFVCSCNLFDASSIFRTRQIT